MVGVTEDIVMTPHKAASKHSMMNLTNSVKFGAQIVAHPSRSSMGQALAGKGQLVFEGELLEIPFGWHPSGTSH
jgi:hypothetical protein